MEPTRTLALLVTALAHAQPVPFETIRTRVAEMLDRIPRYTCVETIERTIEGDLCDNCDLFDRMRMEVLVANGRELVSWPGESQFRPQSMAEIVDFGMTVAGHLAGFAEGVFAEGKAVHVYRRKTTFGSREVFEFHYQVAAKDSTFRLRVGEMSSVAGSEGTYLVDAATHDLVRLDFRVSPMPGWLGMKETYTAIDYARTPIGGSSFVLPARTSSRSVCSDGKVNRNTTRYSGCREFTASSTVRFDSAETTGEQAPLPAKVAGRRTLPLMTRIESRLETEIDLALVAAGDPIQLRVTQPVTAGEDSIPAGSVLLGRVTRFNRLKRGGAPEVAALVFRIHSLQVSEVRHPILLALRSMDWPERLSGVVTKNVEEGAVIQFLRPAKAIPSGTRFGWTVQ